MRHLIRCLLLIVYISKVYAGDALGFVNPPQSADETAGGVDFLVSRTGNGSGAVAVDVQIGAGNGTLGVDYGAPVPSTISWADGDVTMKTVHLPILHNPAFTYGCYFSLDLVNPTGGATVTPAAATVNFSIEEQDANPAGRLAVVAVSQTQAVNVRDDVGHVDVQVERRGGTLGAVSANLGIYDQTTTVGVDYTLPGSTTLSWADGEGGIKTLTIPILPRAVAIGPRTMYVAISSTSGTNFGPISGVSINILDHVAHVAGSLAFPDEVTVRESAGTAQVRVDRIGGSTGAVSVDYTMFDGLALDGVNYTAVSGTLNWADGDATAKTISIPLLMDGLARPPLTAVMSFSNPTGGVLLPLSSMLLPGGSISWMYGGSSSTLINILDADGVSGVLGFSNTTVTVSETAGTAMLWVTRSGGSIGAVAVDWTTANATAIAGVNYTAASGTLHWADGDVTPKSMTIPILHDGLATLDLYAGVTLSNPTGGAGINNGEVYHAYCALAITNVDAGAGIDFIAMQSAAIQVNEAAGVATITVTRTGTGVGPVSAQIIASDSTALLDVDYGEPLAHVLQWADGDLTAKTVDIPIIDNALPGSSRSFDMTIGVVWGLAGAVSSAIKTTVTIVDDDATPAGLIGFAVTAVSSPSNATQVQLTVQRTGGSTGAVSVSWATVLDDPATARASVDVIPEVGTLSWANGDVAAKTITVTLADEGEISPDRTFFVQLADATGGAVIDLGSSHDRATVTLTEGNTNTAGTIACVHATQTVDHTAASTATIVVSRSSGSTGAVSVGYHTTDGTALAGSDFTTTVGVLSWANGDSANKGIVVPLLTVASGTPDHLLTITIDTPAGGASIGLAQTDLTLTESASSTAASPSVTSSSGGGGCGGSVAGVLLLCLTCLRNGRGHAAVYRAKNT